MNEILLAEYLFGKGKELKSVAYIHCGIGLRSAIIKDGSIIRSMNDREDAFGHMIIEPYGEKCICGNLGCIECYSSLDSIIKRIGTRIKLKNPDIVILSGPLMMNFKNYYERCIETFNENNHNAQSPIFSKGGWFQEDTIAIGSVASVMEFYLKALKK